MTAQRAIYHERQSKELCALHTLNNLFQEKNAFTKKEMDEICKRLSPDTWINPHKSIFGLGNYDVNVIMAALQSRNYEVIWFDARKDVKKIRVENVYGLILNFPGKMLMNIPFSRKHWIAIQQVANIYYNLDSKLSSPLFLGNDNALKTYLQDELRKGDRQLLLVVTPEVSQNESWFPS